jgi:zinc protease
LFQPLRHVTSHLLPNGLRVLLKEERSWPLVSVQAWIRVGSVDEAESEAGLAHVLEHMVFKGTQRHAAPEISRWVEAHGGSLNAETSKEYTHYYIDLPSSGAQRAVHLMGELLCRATLDPREWARERPVILEEMKRRHDDPETMAWELLQEAVYADTAHARPVIGSLGTVSSFSAEAVRRFYHAHYTAAQTLVVIVGDFKSREVLGWLRREFGSMPKGENKNPRTDPIMQPAGVRKTLKKSVQQSYAVYGFPTPPADHPDQEALDLLAVLLGEGRNSRLVHTLREEKKLVWSVGTSNITQEGPGIFAIFAECDPKKEPATGPAVRGILKGLMQRFPSSEEIRRAKNLIQTSWLQGYETFHSQASILGAYTLEGHLERLQNYLPKILAIDSKNLAPVIDRYFSQALSGSVVAP